jgi:hypothetical protein
MKVTKFVKEHLAGNFTFATVEIESRHLLFFKKTEEVVIYRPEGCGSSWYWLTTGGYVPNADDLYRSFQARIALKDAAAKILASDAEEIE